MTKPVKTIRKTVVATFPSDADVDVLKRSMAWEYASRQGNRRVVRIEYAPPSSSFKSDQVSYMIDLEITAPGASRHDFTRFAETYLPKASLVFITL